MSVPENRVEDRALSPDAVGLLREAGSAPEKDGFTYWPFSRGTAPWLTKAVAELVPTGLVELSDADHGRITPAGREALVRAFRQEPDADQVKHQTERSLLAMYAEWHRVEDRARQYAREGNETAARSMGELGTVLLRKAVRAEAKAREGGRLPSREAER